MQALQAHYAKRPRNVPQSEPLPGMVKNSAGGHAFAVDDWARLDRFLILGSDGGTYYIGAKELTCANAKCVERCLSADPDRTLARIVEISDSGRAPKNDPALFALALAFTAKPAPVGLSAALRKVARTGTHLFTFATYADAQRGWGRKLRSAVAAWYTSQDAEALAFQMVKYRQRDGWTHRDLLRLAHPKASALAGVFNFACGRPADGLPAIVRGYQVAQADGADHAALVAEYGLPWEALPTAALKSPDVWRALLPGMKLHAMTRNLARMTANGTLAPFSPELANVVARLSDEKAIRKSRLHPLAVLLAAATYAQGHGDKGKLTWQPLGQVTDALNDAFYKAFANVVPTGKRILLALDVSGSMDGNKISGTSIDARQGSAAMALVTARTEPNHHIVAFTSANAVSAANGGAFGTAGRRIGSMLGGQSALSSLNLSQRARLDALCQDLRRIPMGGTDCALPMLVAMQEKWPVDAFVIYTDSETWAGNVHPVEALRQYRAAMNIPAKLVVVGMCSNGFSIADPNDAGMMDVVGFDAAAPAVIADFIRDDAG